MSNPQHLSNAVVTVFSCSQCGGKWQHPGDVSGHTQPCPQCQQPLAAEVQSSLSVSALTPVNRSQWWMGSFGGIPVGVIVVVFVALGTLTLLGCSGGTDEGTRLGTTGSTSPATTVGGTSTTAKVDIADLTKRAWDAMQAIDSEVKNTKFSKPSQKYRAANLQYANVNLKGADPKLAAHFSEMMTVYRDTAMLLEEVEAAYAELDRKAENAARLGAVVGSALSDKETKKRNALGFGVIAGVVSRAGQEKQRKALKVKFQSRVDAMQRRMDELGKREAALAKTLSQSHGQPFVDLF